MVPKLLNATLICYPKPQTPESCVVLLTLHPRPKSQNPKILNPETEARNPNPQSLNLAPYTETPQAEPNPPLSDRWVIALPQDGELRV